jgi:hypothetical protein
MDKRGNEAFWVEAKRHWRIKAARGGAAKEFLSARKGKKEKLRRSAKPAHGHRATHNKKMQWRRKPPPTPPFAHTWTNSISLIGADTAAAQMDGGFLCPDQK